VPHLRAGRAHDTLLAYLVRRLLENGANSSFVNRIADENVPLEELAQDPVLTVQAMAKQDGAVGAPHAGIPLPRAVVWRVPGQLARHRPGRRIHLVATGARPSPTIRIGAGIAHRCWAPTRRPRVARCAGGM
jgi:hypothetical protein